MIALLTHSSRYGSDVSRMAFAKQMAERYNNGDDNDKKSSKIRTSKPKGSKFAAGYVDRAKMRSEQETEDGDRAARLAALEELYKKGEVEQAVYEKLRFEIAGGDLSSTHLVKGLDFKLLNRVRMGEDVYKGGDKEEKGEKAEDDDKEEPVAPEGDVDDEFEKMEGSEVQAVEREKAKKKGQYSTTTAAVAGQKRSRDQILAEMKAQREAAKQAKAAAAGPALNSRFKKIGAPQAAGSRIEIDSRGREVLVIVDEDGHEKRKVRKAAAPPTGDNNTEAPKVDGTVLGMEVPEFYKKKQEAEAAAAAAKEVDIFEDAGSDYDPLAGMDSESSDEDSDEEKGKKTEKKDDKKTEKEEDSRDAKRRRRSSSSSSREDGEASDASSRSTDSRRRRRRSTSRERRPAAEPSAAKPRNNYFGGSTLLSEQSSRGGPSLNDPSVLAALRKAKQMREASESEAKSQALSKEAEREARLKKLMQSSDRDAEDLDMGFGTNRLEDTEDLDEDRAGRKERLSTWRGGGNGGGGAEDDDNDEEGGGGSRGDKSKRKRGGKKRKGDGNNAEDVMRVLERRKEAS